MVGDHGKRDALRMAKMIVTVNRICLLLIITFYQAIDQKTSFTKRYLYSFICGKTTARGDGIVQMHTIFVHNMFAVRLGYRTSKRHLFRGFNVAEMKGAKI